MPSDSILSAQVEMSPGVQREDGEDSRQDDIAFPMRVEQHI
jgi:hypothetical protein